MKKRLIILAIVIVVILALGLVKDQILRSTVTVVASQVIGAPVHIEGFSLGLWNQSVRVSGFKMYNPQGFSPGIIADLPKINVKYDLGALLKRKIHLVLAEIEIKEIGLQKNSEGKMNVDELKVVKEGAKQKEAKPAEMLPLQIDLLKLSIGRIVSKDYKAGKEPAVKVFEINIHKSYKNITSAQQLAALILAEPMKAAGIQGAKIYGAAMLAGVAVLPVAIAATFVGRDSVQQEFSADLNKIYEQSLSVMQRMGRITREDKANWIIQADISSAQVYLKIRKKAANKSQVVISARKYFLPKPAIAGGVLYEISQKIK